MRAVRGIGRVLVLVLAVGVLAPACGNLQIQTIEPPKEEPAPDPLEGETRPELESTDAPGLSQLAGYPRVFYYEPDELWYRWAYNRWYQAFRWNGHWFIPERVPDPLVGRIEVDPVPTAQDLEADPSFGGRLPTIPELEDRPIDTGGKLRKPAERKGEVRDGYEIIDDDESLDEEP